VRIGDHPAAAAYRRTRHRACEVLGIPVRSVLVEPGAGLPGALRAIEALNRDDAVDGILVETPAPADCPAERLFGALAPEKDVEGATPANLGRLYLGESGFPRPCTAAAALFLLDWYGLGALRGIRATVLGQGPVVGRAISLMLFHREATPSMVHIRTEEGYKRSLVEGADLVVSAVGRPGLVCPEGIRPGAVLVDVGITVTPEGLKGDVDPRCAPVASAWTPVPGGVGPVTVSILLANLLLCASARRGTPILLPPATQLAAAGSAA